MTDTEPTTDEIGEAHLSRLHNPAPYLNRELREAAEFIVEMDGAENPPKTEVALIGAAHVLRQHATVILALLAERDRLAKEVGEERDEVRSLQALGEVRLAALRKSEERPGRLRRLVQVMLDNDPHDYGADGVTMLDMWRKEARAALAKEAADG